MHIAVTALSVAIPITVVNTQSSVRYGRCCCHSAVIDNSAVTLLTAITMAVTTLCLLLV